MVTVMASAAAVRSTTAIADARDTARAFLEGLQQPTVAPDAADTVVLVVSELVTNALRHGGGRCILELTAHPDTIEVAVHDASRHVPRMRTPDLHGGTGGFGWPMVTDLARATAVTRRASGGKTVSAFIARQRHLSNSRMADEYSPTHVEA
jgi:anti-sigma regulatory factor (Ser/Thr protein kinase)